MSPSEFNAGTLVDEGVTEDRRSSNCSGIRFNFSKPLCLVLAATLLLTMLLTWLSFSATVGGVHLLNGKETTIFSLRPFLKSCYTVVMRYIGSDTVMPDGTDETVWIVDGVLMLLTLYFLICAAHFLLFGIVGLFSKGKLRYYFARVGSTMYFIGTLVLIAAVLAGGILLKRFFVNPPDDMAVNFSVSVQPCIGLFIACAASILFRTLGIRLLRYLNGISCMNKGDLRTAEREFAIINYNRRIPKTFSKRKHRKIARYDKSDEREIDYGDRVV